MSKYLILGDFILDTYIFGEAHKISPEAPVMEFLLNGEIKCKLGGAANVAFILDNLGIEGIFLTKTGVELNSDAALKSYGLKYENIQYVPIVFGKTCLKIRLIDINYRQHVIRIAQEDGSLSFSRFVYAFEKQDLTGIELVVFSDYQKGFLSDEIIRYVREQKNCQDLPILVAVKHNWKGYSFIEDLPDVACVVGNHREIATSFSVSPKEVLENSVSFAKRVVEERSIQNCIITLGGKGATYYSSESGIGEYCPTTEREIFDVTGAGDSFFAVITYLWGKCDIEKIVEKANLAAGMNVVSLGNTLVRRSFFHTS